MLHGQMLTLQMSPRQLTTHADSSLKSEFDLAAKLGLSSQAGAKLASWACSLIGFLPSTLLCPLFKTSWKVSHRKRIFIYKQSGLKLHYSSESHSVFKPYQKTSIYSSLFPATTFLLQGVFCQFWGPLFASFLIAITNNFFYSIELKFCHIRICRVHKKFK